MALIEIIRAALDRDALGVAEQLSARYIKASDLYPTVGGAPHA